MLASSEATSMVSITQSTDPAFLCSALLLAFSPWLASTDGRSSLEERDYYVPSKQTLSVFARHHRGWPMASFLLSYCLNLWKPSRNLPKWLRNALSGLTLQSRCYPLRIFIRSWSCGCVVVVVIVGNLGPSCLLRRYSLSNVEACKLLQWRWLVSDLPFNE